MRQVGKEFEFRFQRINTSEIYAADYQRIPDMKRVKEIVSEFDWNLVNVVKVSWRDGKYWDFDGDHTVLACREHNGGKDLCVWCKVYYGMTYEDEAYYFARQTGKSKEPKLNEKLRASAKAGVDYFATDKYSNVSRKKYERIITNAGFSVDYEPSGSLVNTPRCHKTMLDAFKQNREAFAATMNTISVAFGGKVDGFDQNLVRGIFLFLDEYMDDDRFDCRRLTSVLKKTEPKQIVKDAKMSVNEGKYRYARRILAMYNKDLKRSNKLVDSFV